MTKRILVAIATLAMCVAAGTAGAVDHGFYLGGSLGQSDSGLRSGNINYSDTDVSYKLIAGFRALKVLAFEVNYVDLGNASTGGAQAKTKALDAFVLGILPIPLVDIYAKLGVVSWKTDASSTVINAPGYSGFSFSHSGGDLAYGAGVQMNFGAISARLEYEGFDIQQASTPTLLSLGVTYTFF